MTDISPCVLVWHLIFILYDQKKIYLKSSFPPGWWKLVNQLLWEVISISLPHQGYLASRSIFSGKVMGDYKEDCTGYQSSVQRDCFVLLLAQGTLGCSNFTIHTIMRCWNLGLLIWQLSFLYRYRHRGLLFPCKESGMIDWCYFTSLHPLIETLQPYPF